MSPLRWFRKHATWMLIIFGVVLMAIFGLGPVFDNMAQGFQASANPMDDPVIIKYRGGEVTRSRLDELQLNHHATRRFLGALMEQAQKQCEKEGVQYAPLGQPIPGLSRSDNQDVVDEQMLVRKLLAERAEDEGVVISDGMIDDYLALMAGNADFSPRDWKNINKLVNQRTPLTTIRNHLRLELKSMQMQQYTAIGVPLNPVPTEAVELYSRANDRIECEVVPVSVEDYISKVSEEPSVGELKALFEEGKYDYPDGKMQQPGFKMPRKVNVQYFVADMSAFLENEKAKITDAEVEAEYEKLVAAEDPIVIEVIQQDEPEGFDLNFGDDAAEKKEDAEAPKKPEVKLEEEGDVPVIGIPESKTDEPAVPDPTELLNEKPVEKESGLKVTPSEGDQSLKVTATKDQFVSMVQDETEAAKTADTPAESDSDQEVGGIGDLQLSDESAGPQTDEETKKTRVKPLGEVADQIRERLARAAAFKKKEEATKRASLAMQNYQNEVLRWETSRDKDKNPRPELPNFQSIADENGLSFSETGVVDPFEIRDTQLGKVNFLVQVRSPDGGVRPDFQSVSNKLFLDFDRVEELVPQSVNDLTNGNSYIFWTSEKIDVSIPEFKDAEEKVKEYWKHQQAIELARKAAEAMAEKANSSGKKLTELFPETAAPTGEFTWFRPGRGSTAIFGMPFGVEQPGEEFMKTAFSLENGKTSVAANDPRDTVFVVQRLTEEASIADVGEEFLDKQYFRFKRVPTDVMGAAQHYAQELEFDWRDEFVKSMELKRMK